MKRIGVIQILQETNCFNPVLSTPQDFENFGVGTGDEVLAKYGEVGEIGGFLDGLKEWAEPVEPVGVLRLQAWSGGPAAPATQAWFRGLLAEQLTAEKRLDGLLVALHGAMVGVGEPDMEGAFLEQMRALVGPSVPIVASLDLHAYVTQRMLRFADALVAYHTFPHMDLRQTGVRAARALRRIFSGAKPESTLVHIPMITGGEVQNTFIPPLEPIFRQLQEAESRPDVLSAAILMTQAYLDVPQLGWTVLLVTDGGGDLGKRWTREVAAQCWEVKNQLGTIAYLSASASMDRALKCAGHPVILADGADATNSGAGGDSIHLLKEMLGRKIPGGALTIMVDPAAVAQARSAGPVGAFKFAVGGKRDHVFSQPLPIEGRVVSLQPAAYVLNGHAANNLKIDMGMSAIVKTGDVTLLLVEKPGPGSTPLMYRCAGLEPKDFKVVVVKSPAGFRAEFAPFAADIILTDCPGCASSNFARLPFRQMSRPLWPIDQIADWRSVAWIRENA